MAAKINAFFQQFVTTFQPKTIIMHRNVIFLGDRCKNMCRIIYIKFRKILPFFFEKFKMASKMAANHRKATIYKDLISLLTEGLEQNLNYQNICLSV